MIRPDVLCRQHLLGEHNELHAIFNIITKGLKGFAHHPEVMRWRGKLMALRLRHAEQAKEMQARGYNHKSPLPEHKGDVHISMYYQNEQWQSTEKQIELLRARCKECKV